MEFNRFSWNSVVIIDITAPLDLEHTNLRCRVSKEKVPFLFEDLCACVACTSGSWTQAPDPVTKKQLPTASQ